MIRLAFSSLYKHSRDVVNSNQYLGKANIKAIKGQSTFLKLHFMKFQLDIKKFKIIFIIFLFFVL